MSSPADPDFPACPICDGRGWTVVYEGPVRDGPFGRTRTSRVARCLDCGIERLAETDCLKAEAYGDDTYREHLGQGHALAEHFRGHDDLARFSIEGLGPVSLRGKVVADVGCGGGSLLDHVRGLPADIVAIEPSRTFGRSLQDRGYRWYPTADAAARDHAGKVDVAFAVQVIEHVDDPKAFLAGILDLLSPDGVAFVSTPNRHDILMDLLPDAFPAFFYRTQHRWMFDTASMARTAQAAGFAAASVRPVHRYGISNAMRWLRDRRPAGRDRLGPLDATMDQLWRAWLEASGRSDNLMAELRRA